MDLFAGEKLFRTKIFVLVAFGGTRLTPPQWNRREHDQISCALTKFLKVVAIFATQPLTTAPNGRYPVWLCFFVEKQVKGAQKRNIVAGGRRK